MGYLVIQTQTQGQIVIDGNRVISITKGEKNGDHYLDLILGVQKNNPNKNDTIRLEFSNDITEETLEQYNEALIQCEVNAFINVLPASGEEVLDAKFNPSTPATGSAIRDSFSGTFVNFGSTGPSEDVLGGDTVNWGTILTTSADHLGNLSAMTDCKVKAVAVKWSSTVGMTTINNNSTVSFKFSRAINPQLDVTQASTWATAGTIESQWNTSDGDHPYFIEDVSELNIMYNKGDLLAFTATSSVGFSDTGEDVEVTLILEGID